MAAYGGDLLLGALLGGAQGYFGRQMQLEDRAHEEGRQDAATRERALQIANKLALMAKTPEQLQTLAPLLRHLGMDLTGTLAQTQTRQMGGLDQALAGMGQLQAPQQLQAGPQSAMSPDRSFRFGEQTPARRQELYDLAPGLGGGRPQNEMPATPGGLTQPFGSAGELGGGQNDLVRALQASLAAGGVRPEAGPPQPATNPLAQSLYTQQAEAKAEKKRKAGIEERETVATETYKKGAADRAIAGANEAMRRLGYEVIPQGVNAAGENTYTLRPVQTPEFQHTEVPYPPPKATKGGGGRPGAGAKLQDLWRYYSTATQRGDEGSANWAIGEITKRLGRAPTEQDAAAIGASVEDLSGANKQKIGLGVQNLEARTNALAGKLSDAERSEIQQIRVKLQLGAKEKTDFVPLERKQEIDAEAQRLQGRWNQINQAAAARAGGGEAPAAGSGAGEAAPDHARDLLEALKHIQAMPSVEAQSAAIQRVADAAGAEPGLDKALFEQIHAITEVAGRPNVMKARLAKAIQALEAGL